MNDFDRWIKGELENHEAARPEAAWDQFASRLDAPESLDTESAHFDASMKNKLAHFEASYQEQHWKMLSRKLEEQARHRAQMVQLKVLEGALLLLILLTLWNLPGTSRLLPSTYQPIAQLPSSPREHTRPILTQPVLSDLNTISQPPDGNTFSTEANLPSSQNIDAITLLPGNGLAVPISLDKKQTDPLRSSHPATPSFHLVEASQRTSVDMLEAIAHQETSLLETKSPVLVSMLLPNPNTTHRHKISMAIHGDLNYVMTPYDQLLVKKGYDQLVSGYGGTIGYLHEGKSWSWRANLVYSRTYYLPKPYTEVFDGDIQRGYFAETIRDIELNMVSLSLQVQKTLKRKNRWHSYAILGGTGHLAFQANYDRKQSYIPGADPNPNGTPEPLNPSKTSQKRYADGFFEGGSLAENSYMTVDLGIGLENQLNERVSVFMEPVYQHNPFKKSLGPNNDRINTLSIALGTRISL